MAFKNCFTAIPALDTERLHLRAFAENDLDQYLRYFSAPAIHRYLGGILIPKPGDDAKRWLENINTRNLKTKLAFTWHIVSHLSGQSLGRVDLGGFQQKKVGEIAYYIWEQHWGNGYAREAIMRVVKFGFDELELERIQAVIHCENNASQHVIALCGFAKEGLLQRYPLGKTLADVVMYAKINHDRPHIEQTPARV